MNIPEYVPKDKIAEILLKDNPTPEEALVITAYRKGYCVGRQAMASEHNYMLNNALNGADRVRYRKMLRGFLARYFTYLNCERTFIDE